MDWAIKEYIDQNLPMNSKAVYNEPTWVYAEYPAGPPPNCILSIPENKNEGRVFIIVHQIYLSTRIGGGGGNMTFIDTRIPAKVLFQYFLPAMTTVVSPFIYVVRGQSLTITADGPAVGFGLLYQTITATTK